MTNSDDFEFSFGFDDTTPSAQEKQTLESMPVLLAHQPSLNPNTGDPACARIIKTASGFTAIDSKWTIADGDYEGKRVNWTIALCGPGGIIEHWNKMNLTRIFDHLELSMIDLIGIDPTPGANNFVNSAGKQKVALASDERLLEAFSKALTGKTERFEIKLDRNNYWVVKGLAN